ncbi:serine/threonine-protein kinase VRK1 [Fundulus heteroclitus]|uniref:serine/threonine-protein kinase VRK1 n=1 Tax=Fundulus heteroclitus TaxID=8078 RepID=UPI00165B7956|nr:serine/threonine-protein kinase VRK1 [Fundulus heteroclitus]XP_035985861.1 serine/threonine-protein kinase VRK1 [Fundulus heteroclitus]
MPPKAKAAGKGRAPAKRKLAEEFPPGEVLTDTGKKSWKLGPPVGKGGFGLIYLAEPNSEKPVGPDARYVIKVEPSENGPLFCELNFYTRAAKPDLIQKWLKAQNLKQLGVPKYWGSGQHDKAGKRYRFMVIDRLGTDLQKKFEECGKRFPRKLVLQLGLRLLDTLEFIHEHEYVHADIKASNLMLGHSDPNQVYLVDYGLAYRYAPDGVLKEYKEDPKKCHNGTIEFTSIDAHKGASPCRRSDLQILSYCMVQWLCGRLPWEDRLQDPVYVRDSKIRSQENISEFLSQCFPTQDKPAEIQVFMEEVMSLGYNDKPPYERLRSILQNGLKSIQAKDDSKLEFTPVNGEPTLPAKKTTKRKKAADKAEESVADGSPIKKAKPSKKTEVNGVKKSPKAAARPRKLLSAGKQGDHKSRVKETATQTSPGLSLRSRGRKKVSS